MHTIDKHFRDLTKAAFARHGFAHAELMAQWPEIAGERLGGQCRPERIRWPRGEGEGRQKSGGTLVIRAAAGRGLDLQHETPQIIERINRFYGYGAIAAVRIVQEARPAEREKPQPVRPLDAAAERALLAKLEAVADPQLKAALVRLGAGALRRRPGSPQNE
ncbi:MAG: DUF721 domain-containing protein [Hyphomicrobiales bacterium]